MSARERLDKLEGTAANWAIGPSLVSKPIAALRAVLDLHHLRVTEDGLDLCSACCAEDGDEYLWPCPTVQAIEKALE